MQLLHLFFLLLAALVVRCDENIDPRSEIVIDDENEDIGETVRESVENSTASLETPVRLQWMISKPHSIEQISFDKPTQFLINLINDKEERNYMFHWITASFRYPPDLNYVLQNLSTVNYNAIVSPKQSRTFAYSFLLRDDYSPRSVVFIMEALYSDDLRGVYRETLVNQTLQILDSDDIFDGQLMFMYLMIFAMLAAAIFGIYHFAMRKLKTNYSTKSKQPSSITSSTTTSKSHIDMNWIPKEHLKHATSSKNKDKQLVDKSSDDQRDVIATRSVTKRKLK